MKIDIKDNQYRNGPQLRTIDIHFEKKGILGKGISLFVFYIEMAQLGNYVSVFKHHLVISQG